MEDIRVLQGYTNRQVVVNEYRGDELVAKDGFHFDRIVQEPNRLLFARGDRTVVEVKLEKTAAFIRMTDFTRHYAIVQGSTRTELYFP